MGRTGRMAGDIGAMGHSLVRRSSTGWILRVSLRTSRMHHAHLPHHRLAPLPAPLLLQQPPLLVRAHLLLLLLTNCSVGAGCTKPYPD